MKKNAITIFLIILFTPTIAYAKCEKDYAAQEREAIRVHYAGQLAQVEQSKNQKIHAALERYKAEYYPEAQSLLGEYRQESAALAQRIRADTDLKQGEYNAQAREIGKEYRQEMSVLKKDKSGKYWAEISDAREEARSTRRELYQMKDEEIADMRAHIADGCKDKRTPLRKAFEGMEDVINKGKPPAPPPTGNGGPGIRG